MKINKLLLAAAGVLAAASSAVSANLTWVYGDANNTWDTVATTNWGGSAWSNATPDSAIFGGAGENVTLGADITAQHLTFEVTGYSIVSGTLTLAGATPTITTAYGATAVISSDLAGSAGFTKDGAGTLTLNNVSKTLTGPIIVNQGILELTPGGRPNVFSTNPAVMLGGGTLRSVANGVTATNTLSGVTLNAGSSTITSALISGTSSFQVGAITRNVGGTVLFSQTANNTPTSFSGANIVVGGSNDAGGILGGYAITNDTGGSFSWAVKGVGAVNTIKAFGDGASWGTFATDLTGPTANVNLAAGAVTATGLRANTLRFNAAGTTLTLAGGATVLTDGGILVTPAVGNSATTITGGTSLAGTAGKDLIIHQNNTAGTLTIATPIVDYGAATGLTKSGAGTLILTGENTYTGVTTVNAGILSLTGEATIGSGDNGVRIAPGATLTVAGTLKLASNTSKIANSGTLDLSSGTAVLDLNERITGITEGSTYKLVGATGTISGKFKDIVGYTPDTPGLKARLNNTNGVITFKKVPEPSTYGLVGAGALAVTALVRRRRRAGKVAA